MERAVFTTKSGHKGGFSAERRKHGQGNDDVGECRRYEDAKRQLKRAQERMSRVLDKLERKSA